MTVLDDLEGFDAYWSGVKYNVLQLGFVFFFSPHSLAGFMCFGEESSSMLISYFGL